MNIGEFSSINAARSNVLCWNELKGTPDVERDEVTVGERLAAG
jgi:hypothetical protein